MPALWLAYQIAKPCSHAQRLGALTLSEGLLPLNHDPKDSLMLLRPLDEPSVTGVLESAIVCKIFEGSFSLDDFLSLGSSVREARFGSGEPGSTAVAPSMACCGFDATNRLEASLGRARTILTS